MNIKKKVWLLLSVIGITLIFFAMLLMINDNKSDESSIDKETSNNEEKTETREEIDINTIDTTILFNVPIIGNNKFEESKFVYQDKKITIDSFEPSEIYAYIISMVDYDKVLLCDINEECDIKISKDLVQKKSRELFGEISQNFPEETIKNIEQKCKFSNDVFNCKYMEEEEEVNDYLMYFQANRNYLNISQLIKAEKDNNYLYLYDQYINLRLDSLDNFNENDLNTYNYYVYKNSNTNDKISDELIYGKDYYENPVETAFTQKIIDKYVDLSTIYVHTFEIEDNNTYRWISTEPVK